MQLNTVDGKAKWALSDPTAFSVGLGTFRARGDEVRVAVLAGLASGFRHIDTASIYKVCTANSNTGSCALFRLRKVPRMAHRDVP
jgi:diketogulonate reductase-like aldo/keto reductase